MTPQTRPHSQKPRRPTDKDLLDRWGRGESAAARELFERYYAPMYRFFSTKVAVGIEDLMQETFTATVAGRAKLRDGDSFRAYLYGTARNVLRQTYRRARVRGDALSVHESVMEDRGPTPSSVIGARTERRLLLEALRALPLDYQIAFELHYWERLTAAEMRQVLGLTERAVRSRLHRARHALRRAMVAIDRSKGALESTTTDLDGWAARLAAERPSA